MSLPSPADELTRRLDAVDRFGAENQIFDTHELEPLLVELLAWIRGLPEATGDFEQVFVDRVEHDGWATVETLEFCMHTLRYPRVRERLETIRDDADDTPRGYNTRSRAERMLEAFSDDWEDAKDGMWPFYESTS